MTEEQQLNELLDSLEPYLPHDGDTEYLFRPPAKVFSQLEDNIDGVEDGLRIETASEKAELDQRAHPVGISTNTSEELEPYRNRVRFKYSGKTSTGSPDEMIKYTSKLLAVDPSSVELDNNEDSKQFVVRAPATAIEEQVSSISLASSLLQEVTASTCRLDLIGSGTFDYVTEYDYNNSNYDPNDGYASLDADGNITTGGTYSARYT
jgi:hypothetical protein